MKRLAVVNGELDDVDVTLTPSSAEGVVKLKQLDAVDVRSGRCPSCTYSPLNRQDGIIFCKNCGTSYKLLDDEVFEVI